MAKVTFHHSIGSLDIKSDLFVVFGNLTSRLSPLLVWDMHR